MIKKSAMVLAVLIVVALFTVAASIFFKEKKKTVYILTEKILEDYEGAKEIRKKIKDTELKQRSILDSIYLEIQTPNKDGKDNGEKIKKDKEVYQRLYSGFANSNQKQQQEYNAVLWKQINQYLEEYGIENNFDFILGASGNGNIMFADTTLNVTDDVVKYINKKYAGN